MHLGVERGRIAREAEGPARAREMRVDEEEAEPRVGQVLLDAATHRASGSGRPGRPRAPRPVGAFGEPAALGGATEQPAVLGRADRELEPDALVAREQREEAVRGGAADDLQAARRLERAEGGDQIAVDLVEQPAEPEQAGPPILDQGEQVLLTGLGKRRRRLAAGREPLVEERLHLAHEDRARELVGEHGREADRHRPRRVLRLQPQERFQERQVGVGRGLADPIASVGPPPVVQHVGQVAVQREDEVHRLSGHRARTSARR